MGVLNVTPDFVLRRWSPPRPRRGDARTGAVCWPKRRRLDVGGESATRRRPVPKPRRRSRVVPVVEALAAEARVSVDTRKAAVARGGRAGATLVNDVGASLPKSPPSPAPGGRPCTCRASPHDAASPRTTTSSPRSASPSSPRPSGRASAGVTEVWIDPGIGFGKTAEHNWTLAHLDALVATGWRLVGTSRKGFLGRRAGRHRRGRRTAPPDDRLAGSVRDGHLGQRPPRMVGSTTCPPRSSPTGYWRRDQQRRDVRGASVPVKGKWAQGIEPATSVDPEGPLRRLRAPGGYGANHRRESAARREII